MMSWGITEGWCMNLPKYVVSVKAVILRNGKMLVIKKLRNGKIDFGLPGGIANYEESFEEALRREVKEEIGIEIEIKRLLLVKKYKHPYGDWNVAIYYLCEPKSLDFKLGGEEDQKFLEIVWIDDKTKDIPSWLKELYLGVMKGLQSEK